MAAGVYAVGREGRGRFDAFPDILSDDGYFRLHFTATERPEIRDAVSIVTAPATLRDLIRIKTRSRLGALQLRSEFPELFRREAKTRRYMHALVQVLKRPSLYPSAVPYLYVAFVSLLRAKRQARTISKYRWERDDSSR